MRLRIRSLAVAARKRGLTRNHATEPRAQASGFSDEMLAKSVLALLACLAGAHLAAAAALTCSACHARQTATFPGNAMSHALETVAQCDILRANPSLAVKKDSYSYKIERQGDRSLYTVSDSHEALSIPLAWAFGIDRGGQTYVFEKGGTFYESRVSYYKDLKGLDWTMGATDSPPANLIEAAGRKIGPAEETLCFGCHATHAVSQGHMTFDTLVPGVLCVRCHAGAEAHMDSFSKPGAKPIAMKKLGQLTTEETSNFCGQCHRTWEQIARDGPRNIGNLRFQPYRLTKSKCYDTDDQRISCVACHDPHKPLDQVVAHYDSKCQACHNSRNASAKLCKVGTKDCVSCHMPKIELPGSHHLFTDHMIRIARAGEAYPE
ncbi:MAG: multiheme c-type cytochrome [Bryobacteraceae bacterium]